MLAAVSFLGEGVHRNFLILARQIIVGVVVYFGTLIILRDRMIKSSYNLIKTKIKKFN